MDIEAAWPDPNELAEAAFVDSPHPSLLAEELLLSQCRMTTHRRGGPGGQHRNKVSSAVTLIHEPTKVSAEASERRDQSQNRRVAIERLRMRLAITLRSKHTDAPVQVEAICEEAESLRTRWRSRPLKIAESNFERASVMALVLDDLHRSGGQPSLVSALWNISTTSVVQFVASQPAAMQLVNRWRAHHGRSPLRST
jgi:hypothetical protein